MSMERLTAALSDRYRIERELGQGGMATVYLAHDIKHDRKVAVKVLRPELAAVIGAERFLREIKTIAALQHPHILGLIDSGEVNGTAYYVMPFVEGESLRDRLNREKQLPINDAVRLATEVGGALDYAHRHGVIHRDIKPENILLHDGSALVADFGIALAVSSAGGGSRMTETGMSLGTPHYMSPEQAMGEREITARSDVYALGAMTYEMLIGDPPFTGSTAQAIIAKVMTSEPAGLIAQRKSVPPAVEDAVLTALQKLPADRFATAAEFANALGGTAARPHRGTAPISSPLFRRHLLPWLAGLGVVAVVAYLAGRRMGSGPLPPPVVLGHASHLTWSPGLEVLPALSPDGRSVAYAAGPPANFHILVRDVAGGRAVRLTDDTTFSELSPTWLPDGSRVFYLSRSGVFSAPPGGGPARPEIPGNAAAPITSVTFSPDGKRMAFSRGDSLLIRESDGAIRGMARLSEPTLCRWSPDAKFIACATGDALYVGGGATFANLSPGRIVLVDVASQRLVTLTDSLSLHSSPTWSPDGKWLYFISNRDGPRDIYTMRIGGDGNRRGQPFRLSVGLGAHTISLAGQGTQLAYSLYTARTTTWWMPLPNRPDATTTDAIRITDANEYIEQIAVSADGKWLYYDSNLTGNDDIFRAPVGGGEAERLTTDPADDFAPAPSPDGKSFAFHSWRSGSRDIFVQRLDGGGVEQVTHSPRQEALAGWSPDSRALAFSEISGQGALLVVRRDVAGTWGDPVRRADHGSNPNWSPDGRSLTWLSGIVGGSVQVTPADSGPVRTVMDATLPGNPPADVATWASNEQIFFSSHDTHGNMTIYSVAAAGGAVKPVLHFDPVRHPSYRGTFLVRNGRIYFTSDDRQSDIWLIDLKKF